MTQKAKPSLTDMTDCGADDVMIVERKTYEELLAALKNAEEALTTEEAMTGFRNELYVKQIGMSWWVVDCYGKHTGPLDSAAEAWSVIHNAPRDRNGNHLPASLWEGC